MCGSGIGYQINFNYDTCITGKVIHRHKVFKYVSTTKSKFSAFLLHSEFQINQYCLWSWSTLGLDPNTRSSANHYYRFDFSFFYACLLLKTVRSNIAQNIGRFRNQPKGYTLTRFFWPFLSVYTHRESRSLFKELYPLYFVQNFACIWLV